MKEGNGKSVLVVEDEPGIAAVCTRILSREGYQVDIAVNGEVALEMWRRKNYDLCLSDIRTPRMNGIELYRQLEIERPEVVNKIYFHNGRYVKCEYQDIFGRDRETILTQAICPGKSQSDSQNGFCCGLDILSVGKDIKMMNHEQTILIVDDEPMIRRLLHIKLSRQGYRCEEAGNAIEALDKMGYLYC